ncbi:hypothetical protein KEM55_002771 [Ascosphaera atra]|nr:hypothetical protein KEM55_002771 [Ascosphaera atra]
MARPPAGGAELRKGKTLIELAAEREAALTGRKQGRRPSVSKFTELLGQQNGQQGPPPGTDFVTVKPDGKIVRADGKPVEEVTPEDEEMPPLADTILMSFPLSALHCLLSYVAMQQYAMEVDYSTLFLRSGLVAFPLLTFVVHFAHGHVISFEPFKKLYRRKAKGKGRVFKPGEKMDIPQPGAAKQFLQIIFPMVPQTFCYLPIAIYFGMQLVQTTNEKTYYANMKKAPSQGTIWVWAIVEMGLGPSILAFVVPLLWGIYVKGYRFW